MLPSLVERGISAMQMQLITATYENGVFAPEKPVGIPDGSRVQLWLAPESQDVEHLSDEDRNFLRELADKRKRVFQRLAE